MSTLVVSFVPQRCEIFAAITADEGFFTSVRPRVHFQVPFLAERASAAEPLAEELRLREAGVLQALVNLQAVVPCEGLQTRATHKLRLLTHLFELAEKISLYADYIYKK